MYRILPYLLWLCDVRTFQIEGFKVGEISEVASLETTLGKWGHRAGLAAQGKEMGVGMVKMRAAFPGTVAKEVDRTAGFKVLPEGSPLNDQGGYRGQLLRSVVKYSGIHLHSPGIDHGNVEGRGIPL